MDVDRNPIVLHELLQQNHQKFLLTINPLPINSIPLRCSSMHKALWLSFVLLIQFNCFGQDLESNLRTLTDRYHTQGDFHGRIVIDTNGQTIFSTSIGYMDISNRKKADSNTLYSIGSITKTFIATLILMEVQEGKLNLTDPISIWHPSLPHSNDITVKDLLKHQSGYTDRNFALWKQQSKPLQRIEKPHYANVNYGLLGIILEKVQNKELNDILRERITQPAGLNNTSFSLQDSLRYKLATPYFKKRKNWEAQNSLDFELAGGAGAMVSTPEDLNQFFHLLFHFAFINKEHLAFMSNINEGYAMGLFQAYFQSMKGFTNSGQFSTYKSTVVYFPEQGLSISITSNASDCSLNEFLIEIMTIYSAMD